MAKGLGTMRFGSPSQGLDDHLIVGFSLFFISFLYHVYIKVDLKNIHTKYKHCTQHKTYKTHKVKRHHRIEFTKQMKRVAGHEFGG